LDVELNVDRERLHNPGSKMVAGATVIRDGDISVTPQ